MLFASSASESLDDDVYHRGGYLFREFVRSRRPRVFLFARIRLRFQARWTRCRSSYYFHSFFLFCFRSQGNGTTNKCPGNDSFRTRFVTRTIVVVRTCGVIFRHEFERQENLAARLDLEAVLEKKKITSFPSTHNGDNISQDSNDRSEIKNTQRDIDPILWRCFVRRTLGRNSFYRQDRWTT